MSSSEEVAYPILRKHDVDYVLVIFGGVIDYFGDDINKFLWAVRIAQGVWPDEIQEPRYFTPYPTYSRAPAVGIQIRRSGHSEDSRRHSRLPTLIQRQPPNTPRERARQHATRTGGLRAPRGPRQGATLQT